MSMNHVDETLIQVHVIFRHGDKTPDKSSLYPNDPYKEENYHPYGHGQLTDKGKRTAEKLGRILREKYNGFLGETYNPGVLDPWSSILPRCKTTLELLLAVLFPPPSKNEEPIPYKSCARIFLGIICNPVAVEAYEKYVAVHGKELMESRSDVLRYMEQHSGMVFNTIRDAAILVNTLISQDNMGLSLPAWTKKIWPDASMDILNCEYDIMTATTPLKYFSAGILLEKIIEDSKSKIDGKSTCKMHLYSGHDLTLATLLRCLGVQKPELPSYCACMILELHNFDGVFGYKISYQWNVDCEAELFAFNGTGSFFPFEDFLKANQPILDQKHLNPDY